MAADRRVRATAACLFWSLLSAPASAADAALLREPDWLSEVLAPDLGAKRSSSKSALVGLTTEPIEVKPLDSAGSKATGVLPPEQSGIPSDIWGSSKATTLSRLMTPFLPEALPEITAFWHRLALAETLPPEGKGGAHLMMRARVDHLLNAGALDQAEALLQAASPLSPELFARAFDVGLLTQRADSACATMRSDPGLAPGLKARMFCLARSGDWAAAALTLRTAETLGQISARESALIGRFLDPELYEADPPPPPSQPLSALDFTMREALALPRARGTLPLAFLHADLDNTTPWRDRILATERLVRAQALPPSALLELYLDGTSAASGGIWVRIDAVQELYAALDSGDDRAVGAALLAAWKALQPARLGFVLSGLATEELRDLELTGEAARLRFDLWLISPAYKELVWDYDPQSAAETLLQAVALNRMQELTPNDDIAAAVIAGMTRSDQRNALIWAVEQNQRGEAILKALTSLVHARHADPHILETALVVLRRSGLEDDARRIAIQALLASEGRL